MLSTSQKILIARILATIVISLRQLFCRPTDVKVRRRGVAWLLNLKEGIDFSIYLLGGFELRTLRRYAQIVKEGDIVFDIGANIGAHTLPLAQLVGSTGKVFSFEPTTYAFNKQLANICLNAQLSQRISAHQMMLTAADSDLLPELVYSSWPLESASDLHNEHHGRLMKTSGSTRGTLDNFVQRAGIETVNFIKLDVDGNENDVLIGARHIIEKSKPKIMLELAPYVYKDHPEKFDNVLTLLWAHGYEIADVTNNNKLPRDPAKIRQLISPCGSINAIASPYGF